MDRHVVLIKCPDQKGLIHKITGVLFQRAFNIVRNAEFVDPETGTFFMRSEVEGELNSGAVTAELHSVLPHGAEVRIVGAAPKSIVVFVTREYHCLGELLTRHEFQTLGARILAVVSNHDSLGPFVEKFRIPFHYVPHEGLEREEHERRILGVLEPYPADYIVLAKYMRILTPAFVANFRHRIVNIHHSFLPAFAGANPYKQAYQRGVKIIGATAHFVTDELDEGPIIAQSVIPVDHTHGWREMAQAGRDVEKITLARALRFVFEDRVFVSGNRTIIFD
ncbi:MAG: formyltetrahydrofolate deformylase [Candidatus Sumerlaeia bacterium]